MSETVKQSRGEHAELAALEHLQAAGLRLVTRNYRCKLGEIDLVMADHQQIVFVEVRYRSNNRFGSALESITPAKQRKVRAAAQVYLKQLGKQASVRFDAVGLSPTGKHSLGRTAEFNIDWCQNAF